MISGWLCWTSALRWGGSQIMGPQPPALGPHYARNTSALGLAGQLVKQVPPAHHARWMVYGQENYYCPIANYNTPTGTPCRMDGVWMVQSTFSVYFCCIANLLLHG